MLNFKTAALLGAVVLFPRLMQQEPGAQPPCQQWEIVHVATTGDDFTPMTLDAGWEPFAWDYEYNASVARHCLR
jgi:hypothetical protein